MLIPLKGVSLRDVIESLYGFKVLSFDKSDKKDIVVLGVLKRAADDAAKSVNKKGITMSRPNEVGNAMEPFVEQALNNLDYKTGSPLTESGVRRSAGYPDLEFVDEFRRTNYLEVKTFNIVNISTTQRSFYFSPAEDPKITKDAHHFVISFEIYIDGRSKGKNIYKCKSWKILSVENLKVDVKYEFNADNARLYSKDLILAEGDCS